MKSFTRKDLLKISISGFKINSFARKVGLTMQVDPASLGPPHNWPEKCGLGCLTPLLECKLKILTYLV